MFLRPHHRLTAGIVLAALLLASPSWAGNKNRKRKRRGHHRRPAVTQTAAPTCPAEMAATAGWQPSRRVVVLGTAALAVTAGGLWWLFSGPSAPSIVVVGGGYRPDAANARSQELVAKAKRGELVLAVENVNASADGEKSGIYGLENPVAAFVADYATFRWFLYEGMFVKNGKRLGADRSAAGVAAATYVQLARGILRNPESAAMLGNLRLSVGDFENSPTLQAVGIEAADAHEIYLRFMARATVAKTIDELLRLDIAGLHRDPAPILALMSPELKAVFDELGSDSTLVSLIAADEVFRARLLSKLRPTATDSVLQTPAAVLEYFERYPTLANVEAFNQDPYQTAHFAPLQVEWRNAIATRHLKAIVEKAAKAKKPLYVIVADENVEGLVKQLQEVVPEDKVRAEGR